MADTDPTATPAPPEPATSLTPEALQEGLAIESLMAVPNGPYWKGPDAAAYQSRYIGLLRGQLAGAPEAVAAPEAAGSDPDLPIEASRYDYGGLHIYTAADRDVIDAFAPVAHAAGIGRARMRAAIAWALDTESPTPAAFRAWASEQGWPAKQIKAALDWHTKRSQT